MTDKPGIDELHKAYREALESFTDAESSYSQASIAKTDALNRLNQAQRAFDTAVEAIRGEAPRGSDWKSYKDRGE